MMTWRRWTLVGALVAITAAIWLIESDRMMRPSGINIDSSIPTVVSVEEKARRYRPAQELVGIAGYLNTEPFKLADVIGEKVILIDFWTYSCINCVHTLPYLKKWHNRFADEGLVILGVHAPEFQYERKPENVAEAVKKFGLTYPIALDNGFKLWRSYKNRYWPALYLIDHEGVVRFMHFGEGKYAETEAAIVELLSDARL